LFQLQYRIGLLRILSARVGRPNFRKSYSQESWAQANSYIIRRLAESKGSPRIDYECVLCMRKP
jgi:hypothetical protein